MGGGGLLIVLTPHHPHGSWVMSRAFKDASEILQQKRFDE